MPRWPDVRRHRDRRRSPLCCAQLRQRGKIHALESACTRPGCTGLRHQIGSAQGGSSTEETRSQSEGGLGSAMPEDLAGPNAHVDRWIDPVIKLSVCRNRLAAEKFEVAAELVMRRAQSRDVQLIYLIESLHRGHFALQYR